jgi:diguanylate cyclase (GGDEF)-like protein
VLALASTLVFLLVLSDHFELSLKHTLVISLLFVSMNLFGAYSAYRVSRLTRENFRDAQVLRQANLRLTEEVRARQQLEQELIAQVHLDELTGAVNSRRFHELARQHMRQTVTTGQPLSLLLLDVDYFKQINDTYGHLRGDEVLKALARICEKHLGEEEALARVGGEEFALLLPDTDLDGGRRRAEQIRTAVWQTPISLVDTTIHISVSIGVVQWRTGDALAELMARADQALHAAKYKGRNRVEAVRADEGLSTPRPSRENV